MVARAGADDADDLAAEVFTRAFAARRRFRLEFSSARPWLLGIAANLLRQRARGLRRRSRALGRLRGHVGPEPDDLDLILARVDAMGLSEDLAEALGRLNEGERRAVSLCLVGGLTQREAAEVLGVPVGTIKARVSRARVKLAQHLGDVRETNGVPEDEGGRDA